MEQIGEGTKNEDISWRRQAFTDSVSKKALLPEL
jgi:hypothetical protein